MTATTKKLTLIVCTVVAALIANAAVANAQTVSVWVNMPPQSYGPCYGCNYPPPQYHEETYEEEEYHYTTRRTVRHSGYGNGY